MRIIGGSLKRRKITFPNTRNTRPVTDRAKETIFNVLGERVVGKATLDLFAGSGSLGLEALSRGASSAHFVDISALSVRCIRTNLVSLGLGHFGTILKTDVDKAIKKLGNRLKKFDLIFLDPPHNKGLIKKTLHQLDRSDTIHVQGIIIVGHSNREGLPENLINLHIVRKIKIGQAFVTIIEKKS
jgi:16S rRNA (guanine966-N2)-methyltransferase